jgi:metal-responsive CopG/Arc/MetJ family transcriptional regulator
MCLKKQTTIQIEKDLLNKLTILSINKSKKRNEIIKEALTYYLKINGVDFYGCCESTENIDKK